MYNVNDTLKLKNSNMFGIVIDISKSRNKISYKLNINNKLTTVNEELIEKKIDNIKMNKETKTKGTIIYEKNFIPEIMIRHLTRDEALDELEKFLDKALLNKAKLLKIIHGKNGGILRKTTEEFLKSSEYVESFRLGYPHEGSYGVTIVKLK